MTEAISTNYFNNPFAFSALKYTSNPISSMSGSLFGLATTNFGLNSAAIGNFGNLGAWNTDLMMPQWMKDIQNIPYGFQQYNFNGLGAYNMPMFPTVGAQTTTQTGAQVQATGTPATQAQAQPTVANPYTQYTQQAQTSEDTMKLNMYGISTTGDAKKDAAALKNAEAKENSRNEGKQHANSTGN